MKKTNVIIGKVNTGKTTGIMFPEVRKAISNDESLLILDNKEEYYKTFKQQLDESDYTTFVFNLKDTSKSNSFNPFMLPYHYYQVGNVDIAIDLIHILALEIFQGDNPNSDPFWENSAADYFTALVLIMFKEAKKEEINFGSIQLMLAASEKKIGEQRVIDRYFNSLSVLDPIYIAGSSIVYAPAETRGSIISVMKQGLNAYCMREQLLNNLTGNEIDFTQLPEKTAIFIIGNEAVNTLGNIVIDQAIDGLKKFTFVLDHLCDMPKLLRLNQLLNEKLNTYVIVRDKENLEYKYGKFIMSKFEHIMEDFEVNEYMEVGNEVDYPIAQKKNNIYFDFEEFMRHN